MHAELSVVGSREPPRRFELYPGKEFVLGRGAGVSIRLTGDGVSRRHARLALQDEGLILTDLDSRNGTFLDGHQLEPGTPVEVRQGQPIQIASYTITPKMAWEEDPEGREAIQALLPRTEYEVLDRLGGGTSGSVWLAAQPLLGRKVALKVFSKDLSDTDSQDRQRFLREAQLCSRLKSRFVVELYDARLAGNTAILVMEFVPGASVRALLKEEGPLPIPGVVWIGEHVALALAAAAEHKIIHRDVKPGNILLDPEGRAKLGDFGLAKKLGASSGVGLTKKGEGLGSLAYVAPEQARDARLADHRADLYSLGATLYHMLAGRPPLVAGRREGLIQTVRRLFEEQPRPVSDFRPDCPRSIVGLLMRLLEKDPAARPRSALEVADLLQSARHDLGGMGETKVPV